MSSLNLPVYETIICSTAAGVSSTLLGHPLDTLKVHIQTNPAFTAKTNNGTSPQNRYRYPIVRAAQHLLRSNHYSSLVFFRGIGPPTANAAIMNILTFAVFNRVKEVFGGDGYRASLAAGIISGLASAFVSTRPITSRFRLSFGVECPAGPSYGKSWRCEIRHRFCFVAMSQTWGGRESLRASISEFMMPQ